MHELADWGDPTLVRAALSVAVAVLLVATCVKWLRLRSSDGEQWAWLLLLVQGAMFATLTIRPPSDWLLRPDLRAVPQAVPAVTAPGPADAAPESLRRTPMAIPLRLEVPEHQFDRRAKPVEVFLGGPRSHGLLAQAP